MIDSHQFQSNPGDSLVTRSFKVGGMDNLDAGAEIEDMIGKIDGVKKVTADWASQVVSIEFDSGEVTEGWITRSLNTMGHSILDE